jgi:hypothetical protein
LCSSSREEANAVAPIAGMILAAAVGPHSADSSHQ